jgi:hypothetical protein
MNLLEKLTSLYDQTIEIFESDLPWDTKYDLIFSENISVEVFNLIKLDYYDPDTSYEEDVTAFVRYFKDKMGKD